MILRIVVFLAGLMGASGVALAAMAAHGGEPRLLYTASAFCLAHAPALLAVAGLSERIRLALPAALLIAAGTVLFAGDLVARARLGSGLLPMVAPGGGFAMIAGWLVLAVGGLAARQKP